ncbi:amino acid ABC transporter permease [Streptomyces dysideae]|uniref:Amino acid ABC transporter permease n=1 Tax=Streptomyces dysideae TaxID=909626 RepID=A0A117RZF6_9ACTN|nr:amino acid ABC transporter permease [Streptomyces dysideae]KUO18066.1 amino acid ABC transporter permease [Streptomyces dysideae]
MLHYLSVLANGIGQTVAITVTSFVVGAVLGLPLALMRYAGPLPVRVIGGAVVETVRAIPPIVWLFIVFYGIGSGSVQLSTFAAAVIGLGIIAAAYLSEIYRAGLKAVAQGQWEAAQALGLPRLAIYRKVIFPQMLGVVIPPSATYAIGLLKDSAIASIIGATDITFYATQETQATLQGLSIFGLAALLYIALSIPIAATSRITDRKLTERLAR